ncbi:MAG TPA: alpha/beta hydrolase [Chloroflexota bacterium]|nr:alpha/beta hydrolase [Chloroflexota bacterium]
MERADGAPGAGDSHTMTLVDGRALGFAEFGPAGGVPLFFFHGGGSNRLTRHPDDTILDDLGVRLITIDRPGIGLSDHQPRRKLLDWPDDAAQLADHLGIDTFSVLGWSAGGPHALACAYKIPHRLRAVGVMSGLAPPHWPGITTLATPLGIGVRTLAMSWAWCRSDVTAQRPRAIARAGQPDIKPSHRQGLRDLVQAREWQRITELAMLARPWGFRLLDITTTVHLWCGLRDRLTPPYMAVYLHRELPSARLTLWDGEGHHGGFTHWRQVVAALTTFSYDPTSR